MSALRVSIPGRLVLIDQGPHPARRLPGANLTGRKIEPQSGTNGRTDRDRANEYMRRYRTRKAAA